MNRRDKQRMDDGRRREVEYNAPKPNNNNCDLNSSDSSKSLMDNYFQSQKIIQSLSESPIITTGTGGVNEVKATKSFKIPKKQPVKIETKRSNVVIDRVNGRSFDGRQQVNSRTNGSRRNPRDAVKGNDFNNIRRTFKNDRAVQNRRFDDERRKLDQVRPNRDSSDRKNEQNKIEGEETHRKDDFTPKRNENALSNIEERRKRDDVFTKRKKNDDSVDPSRLKRDEAPSHQEDNLARRLIDSKRPRLDSPSSTRRDRFVKRNPDVNTNTGPSTLEKVRLKNRLFFNEPIEIIIADRAAPNGRISAENAAMFLNEIQKSVAERILTDPINQTKFIGHKHDDSDGLITLTCADDFTSIFIQQKLTEDLALWPGHLSDFLHRCKKTDIRMQIEKWRRIECQIAEDDSGKLFKLAIDKQSYDIIKQQDNVVRCGDLSIKIELDSLNEISEELMSAK